MHTVLYKQAHNMIFSRLLRPHPRVLGISVCASTRCFLAGLKFRVPMRCNYCHVFFVQEQLFFISFFFDPILLIALITNNLLSVVVWRANLPLVPGIGYQIKSRARTVLAARTLSLMAHSMMDSFRFHGVSGTAAGPDGDGRIRIVLAG